MDKNFIAGTCFFFLCVLTRISYSQNVRNTRRSEIVRDTGRLSSTNSENQATSVRTNTIATSVPTRDRNNGVRTRDRNNGPDEWTWSDGTKRSEPRRIVIGGPRRNRRPSRRTVSRGRRPLRRVRRPTRRRQRPNNRDVRNKERTSDVLPRDQTAKPDIFPKELVVNVDRVPPNENQPILPQGTIATPDRVTPFVNQPEILVDRVLNPDISIPTGNQPEILPDSAANPDTFIAIDRNQPQEPNVDIISIDNSGRPSPRILTGQISQSVSIPITSSLSPALGSVTSPSGTTTLSPEEKLQEMIRENARNKRRLNTYLNTRGLISGLRADGTRVRNTGFPPSGADQGRQENPTQALMSRRVDSNLDPPQSVPNNMFTNVRLEQGPQRSSNNMADFVPTQEQLRQLAAETERTRAASNYLRRLLYVVFQAMGIA